MATAFTTVNENVLAAISEWGGLASLQPRPIVRMIKSYNEIAENLKAFGLRSSIWVVRLSSTSKPRFTGDTQLIKLRYRFYIAVPTTKEETASELVYHCNAALIQFGNWKTADGSALPAPSPWLYHNIGGPEILDPAQLSEQEIDLEGVVAVVEMELAITASHTDLMTVPSMTLTAAQLEIAATEVGTVFNDWDAGYGHTAGTMQVKYSNVGNKPLRRVSWMRFPTVGIMDAVAITGITLHYTITEHDGIMATGVGHLTDFDVPNADAEDVWAELLDGNGYDDIDLDAAGAKTTVLADPAVFADLLSHIQAGAASWIHAIVYSDSIVARECTLSPTLSLSKITVDYTHYV